MLQFLKKRSGNNQSPRRTSVAEQPEVNPLGVLMPMLLVFLILACSTPSKPAPTKALNREDTTPIVAETLDLTDDFTEGQLLESATTLLENGDLKGAEAFLTLRLEQDPSEPAALHKLGFALLGQERYAEAIEVFKQELIVDPEFPDAWLGLALALTGDGQHNEAIDAVESVLGLDPNNADDLDVRNWRDPSEEKLFRKYQTGHFRRGVKFLDPFAVSADGRSSLLPRRFSLAHDQGASGGPE